jgi:hypothetical protein
MPTPFRHAASFALLVSALLIASPSTAQDAQQGMLPEPGFVTRAVTLFTAAAGEDTGPSDGWYPELGHMITGAGWIALGPGYRHRLFNDRALVDASTAVSWRAYRMAQARFELPTLVSNHLTIGTQALWRDMTQVVYYGAGPQSARDAATDYRMQTINGVVYASVRPTAPLALTARIGLLSRPSLSSSAGPFDRDLPDVFEQFADEPGVTRDRQPPFFHADISLTHDTRDARGHPSRGGLYRAGWTTFSDRGRDTFGLERYELEGAHFVPALGGRVVIAARGWAAFTVPSRDLDVPFYLLPSLGGNTTLRSYPDYRFHDRDLLVVNVESRWAILTHLDGALFVDAGNVAPEAGGLDLARRSFGSGVRLHNGRTTIVRFDAARGSEGWRFFFRLNDPLRLSRLSRRTATIPMVP